MKRITYLSIAIVSVALLVMLLVDHMTMKPVCTYYAEYNTTLPINASTEDLILALEQHTSYVPDEFTPADDLDIRHGSFQSGKRIFSDYDNIGYFVKITHGDIESYHEDGGCIW